MKFRFDFKSIRFRIWAYVMLFSLAILVMLWLMQSVFLRVFYQGMKTESMEKAASKIATAYSRTQGKALDEEITKIVDDSDVSVQIADESGKELKNYNPEGRNFQSSLAKGRFPPPEMHDAENPDMPGEAEDGQSPQHRLAEFAARVLTEPNGKLMQPYDSERGMSMLLYGMLTNAPDGKKAVVVVNSILQPLSDTVQILSRQLIYLSLVIFAVAIASSVLVAMSISRPLRRISEKAKLLARGRYDMQFDRGGYTEANQLADTLNYATGALMQVENTRRELIANVSHDLRTPLTMIKLYAEMIRDLNGANKQKREQNVAVIVEECDRLTSLVQNLLDLSQLQAGVMPYQPAEFNLDEMITRILKRYDALAQKDGYHFHFKPCGAAAVKADEARIEQVLYNLLNNAVNYAGEDKEITIAAQDGETAVRVSVSDNGEGIAPEDLKMIWDRYYKVDKEHRRAVAGSGLGLSIVKTILDMHNMRYGVESVKGHGATFWFELEKAK